jgi:hypothetical protein
MGGLVQDQGGVEPGQFLQPAEALTRFVREEAGEVEIVGGKTTGGECGDERARAGEGIDRESGVDRGADDPFSGVADGGGSGVRDEGHLLSAAQALEDFLRAPGFVELVVAEERACDVKEAEQLAGPAGVLSGDDIAFPKGAQRAEGDVLKVPDGGCDEVERAGLEGRQGLGKVRG